MQTWFKKLSWYSVLGFSLVIYFLARKFQAGAICAFLFFTIKYLVEFPGTLQRASAIKKRTHRVPFDAFWAFMPPVFPALLKLHYAYARNVFKWVSRKPASFSKADGIDFGYLEKGQYNTYLLIAIIAMIVEVPFSGLMVSLIGHDPQIKAKAHVVLSFLTAYTFFLIIGDRYSVRASSHVLAAKSLLLAIGDRFFAEVDTHEIEKIIYLQEAKRIWCAKNKISSIDTINISPADAPNVIIELKADAEVCVEAFKLKRHAPQYLFIFVDDPGYLIDELSKRIAIDRRN